MSEAWNGVPENPERDGAHSVEWFGEEETWLWEARRAWWVTPTGRYLTPLEAGSARGSRYLGPCLTLAEITAREAASAKAMREACAASCMEPVANTIPRRWKSARDCVDGIYALPIPHASALARALAAAEKRGMEKVAKWHDEKAEAAMRETVKWSQFEQPTTYWRWVEAAERHKQSAADIRNAAAQESEE